MGNMRALISRGKTFTTKWGRSGPTIEGERMTLGWYDQIYPILPGLFDLSQLSPTLMNQSHLESIFGGIGLKRAAINNYDDMGQSPGKKNGGKEKARESSGKVVVPLSSSALIWGRGRQNGVTYFLKAKLNFGTHETFHMLWVYGTPYHDHKVEFWSWVETTLLPRNQPWFVGGDFNE